MLYEVMQAKNFAYELLLAVKYDKGRIITKTEIYRGFEFFNLKLRKIRR